MGFYLGGDRDDANNYANVYHGKPKKLTTHTAHHPSTVEQTVPGVQKGISLPQEFDVAYYLERRDAYNKSCPDYWEWVKFGAFSQAVFAFYRQVAAKFYQQYPAIEKSCLPPFFDLAIKPKELEPLAQNVRDAEHALCMQFSKSKTNRQMSAKFKKHKALRLLRQQACQAWAMYYALTQNLHISDALKFKDFYQNADFSVNLDVIKTFRGCKLLQFYMGKSVGKLKNNLSKHIYSDEDVFAVYEHLLQSVGCFEYADYQAILNCLSPDVKNLEGNQTFSYLINIYNNFGEIYYVARKLMDRHNVNASYAERQAKTVLKEIDYVLSSKPDKLIEEDLIRLKSTLKHALATAEDGWGK